MKDSRNKIIEIDEKLLKLFEQRFELAKNIANYKFDNNLPIYDQERENALFEKYKIEASEEFSDDVVSVFKALIETSKNIQAKVIEKKAK